MIVVVLYICLLCYLLIVLGASCWWWWWTWWILGLKYIELSVQILRHCYENWPFYRSNYILLQVNYKTERKKKNEKEMKAKKETIIINRSYKTGKEKKWKTKNKKLTEEWKNEKLKTLAIKFDVRWNLLVSWNCIQILEIVDGCTMLIIGWHTVELETHTIISSIEWSPIRLKLNVKINCFQFIFRLSIVLLIS